MKRYYTQLLAASLLLSVITSCKEQDLLRPQVDTTLKAGDPALLDLRTASMSKKELEERMLAIALKNNNEFDWRFADDEMIYAGLKYGDKSQILMIGYKLPTIKGDYTWDLNQSAGKDWLAIREKLLSVAFEEERKFDKKLQNPNDILVYASKEMPNFDIRVTEFSTIQKLRETGLIRYMEPVYIPSDAIRGSQNETKSTGYNPFGCSDDAPVHNLQRDRDYSYYSPLPTLPAAKVSWQLSDHGLPAAWFFGATGLARSGSNKRFTVAYIDTGLSSSQPMLNADFDNGGSPNRFSASFSTLPDGRGGIVSPEDVCGHGTATSAIGTAPFLEDKVAGAAWQANMVSVKAAHDVVFTQPAEYRGVADAFSGLARTTVDVISMSMGTVIMPASNGSSYSLAVNAIRDGVMLAKYNKKVIFCAAGTIGGVVGSTMEALPDYLQFLDVRHQVVFPASMNDAVYAVTGVKRQLDFNNNPKPFSQYGTITTCTSCFYHSSVDFGVVNQKNTGSARNMLTLKNSAVTDPISFGGSSSATAMMAGMVTAVWSKYPTLTDEQIMTHVKNFCSHSNNRHNKIGYGMLNAFEAIRYSQPRL